LFFVCLSAPARSFGGLTVFTLLTDGGAAKWLQPPELSVTEEIADQQGAQNLHTWPQCC
jgi:hypothetical protein